MRATRLIYNRSSYATLLKEPTLPSLSCNSSFDELTGLTEAAIFIGADEGIAEFV